MRFTGSSAFFFASLAALSASALATGCVGILGDFDSGDGGAGDSAGPDGGGLHDGSSQVDAGGRPKDGATTADASADDSAVSSEAGDGATEGGDGSTGAVDAGPIDPTMLNGLVAWLDSDATRYTISGSTVTGWADKSGKGNNAKNQLPTTSPTANPANPTFNNKASLHFDGKSYLYIVNNASLAIGDGDFLIALVASAAPGTTSLETLIEKHDPASPFSGPALYVTPSKVDAVVAPGNGVVSQTANANDGNAHYIAAWRSGTTLTVQIDKTQSSGTITAIPASSGGGKDLSIGMELTTTLQNYFSGDIAEIVIVVGSVSGPRAIGLRDYMINKYNL